MEEPNPLAPGTRLGARDSLVEADENDGAGDRIIIPLMGIFLFSQLKSEPEEMTPDASRQEPFVRFPPASSPPIS